MATDPSAPQVLDGDGVTIFVCPRNSPPRCASAGCGGKSVALCDFELGGAKTGERCRRHVCASCITRRDSQDLCPPHAALVEAR